MRSAKQRYEALATERSPVLDMARICSDLCSPGMIPRDGQSDATPLEIGFQSLGAQGFAVLSSKMALALFPPGSPFFVYEIDRDAAGAASPEEYVMARSELARIERKAARKANRERTLLLQVFQHLIVAGNLLLHRPRGKPARLFAIHQYVIRRRPDGSPAEAVVKEQMFPRDLPEEARAAANVRPDGPNPVDVYTVIEWDEGRCTWWTEVAGVKIGKTSSSPERVSPWLALQYISRPNKHWGVSHAMTVLADLMSYEGQSKAMNEFADIAARVIFLDNPNSQTDIEALRTARSGDFVQGQREDVGVLQLEKYADFQVVDSVMQRLEKRLAASFLLNGYQIRDAERVTAEEIRLIAQELEDALGGVYTMLAETFQLPYAERLLHEMRVAGEIPPVPEGVAELSITTGFQALGRAHVVARLRAWLADIREIFGEGAMSYLRMDALIREIGVGYGIEDLDDYIRSAEEVEEEQNQAMMAQAMQDAAPNVASAAANAIAQEDTE